MEIRYFKDLKVGERFYFNGNCCTKKSSRTAYIDKNHQSLWFYFGLNESVGSDWTSDLVSD